MSTVYDNRYSGLAFEPPGTIVIVPAWRMTGPFWNKKRTQCFSVRIVQDIWMGPNDIDTFWKEIRVFDLMMDAQSFVTRMKDVKRYETKSSNGTSSSNDCGYA